MDQRRISVYTLPLRWNMEEELQLPAERSLDRDAMAGGEERGSYGSIQGECDHVRGGRACCVAGEHFMTSNSQEFLRRSLSMDSAVHVDISDLIGEGDAPCVPISLRKCQKTIIAPYSCLLSCIGWRPWFAESRRSWACRFVNVVYPCVVLALVLSNYVFQVVNCQGKFNIHVDVEPSPAPPTPQQVDMKGNCTWGLMTFACHAKYLMSTFDVGARPVDTEACQHIVPTYIVPSFVHFLAFSYGFYHFRMVESEQLFSLMERVFLQSHSTRGLQNVLIRNTRLLFFVALLWLLSQAGLDILYNFTFQQHRLAVLGDTYKQVFCAVRFAGTVLVQGVNVAVAINYCVQCETLILYIRGICLRLHEKSLELKAAMHEILGVREYISSLNGNVAKMMGLCLVNFAELTILGTALLFLNRMKETTVISYRVLFPSLWFLALIVPLIQAARLTRIGSKLRQISFEMRVFGYQAASMLELDSFVLFVSGATLRSKLFGATIRSATVLLTLGLSVFVLLTLMVVDLLSLSGYSRLF